MNIKKNNFISEIYTTYGPVAGKVCENINTQLSKDNIVDSITNPLTNSLTNQQNNMSISDNSLNLKYPNLSKIDVDTYQQNFIEPNVEIPKIKTDPIIPNEPIIKTSKLKINLNNKSIEQKEPLNLSTHVEQDEETFFLNYKVSIFGYKISIWILILILLIIISIGYFIYKYWCLKNNGIITYEKNISDNKTNDDLTTGSTETLTNYTNTSKSSKSSKSSN